MEFAKVHVDLTTLFPLVKECLRNGQVIDEVFNKHIQVEPKDKQVIQKVINLLATSESDTLKLITIDFQHIFSDGVIDFNDIPMIVKIITDILNNKSIVIKSLFNSPQQVAILIKIIVVVLGRLDVFSNFAGEEQKMLKIVDASLSLLNTSIEVSGGCRCC